MDKDSVYFSFSQGQILQGYLFCNLNPTLKYSAQNNLNDIIYNHFLMVCYFKVWL